MSDYLSDQWDFLVIEDETGQELVRITKDEVILTSSVVIRLKPSA